MEAEEGIEPSNDGFANHCLTTWLLRHSDGAGASDYGEYAGVSILGFKFGFKFQISCTADFPKRSNVSNPAFKDKLMNILRPVSHTRACPITHKSQTANTSQPSLA